MPATPEISAVVAASLPYPPDADSLSQAVDQTVRRVRRKEEPNLLSFLPAKAGSGAALANSLHKKVAGVPAPVKEPSRSSKIAGFLRKRA